MTLGAEIRQWREARGISQLRLAYLAKISQSHMCRIEKGEHADIKLKVDEVVELGELASPSERVTVKDGDLYFPPEAIRAYIDDIDRFQGVMEPWLDPGAAYSVV